MACFLPGLVKMALLLMTSAVPTLPCEILIFLQIEQLKKLRKANCHVRLKLPDEIQPIKTVVRKRNHLVSSNITE